MEESGISSGVMFQDELESNDLNKPPAGITSITSAQEGPWGAIKRTTVNFIVNNFSDFENIYSRFFLKPGALIFIDFGWDTSGIYDPRQIIESNGDIIDSIYGRDEYTDTNGKTYPSVEGIIEESKGDIEVLVGLVTKYNSTVKPNGSYECTLEIVSANETILDAEISNKNSLRQKFANGIIPLVVNSAASKLGKSFLRNNWSSSPETLQESEEYANLWAKTILGSAVGGDVTLTGGQEGPLYSVPELALIKGVPSADVVIGTNAKLMGVYWQSLLDENYTQISDNKNIFVSWAFFEEEILKLERKLLRSKKRTWKIKRKLISIRSSM